MVDGVPGRVRVEAAEPAGHDQAGGKALHIPFERSVERLVEVGDVEDQVALR